MGGMGGGMGGMGGGMGGMGGMGMGRMGMMTAANRGPSRSRWKAARRSRPSSFSTPVTVESELGQYQIRPDRIKLLRLSKPGAAMQMESGFHAMEGSVITTSDKEIKGKVQCPHWSLDLDFGTLTLDPAKVRTMTFSAPAEPKDGKKAPLSQAKPASLDMTLIEGPQAVALMVTGPKITRLAAATEASGDWIPDRPARAGRGPGRADRGPWHRRLRPGPARLRLRLRGQALGRAGTAQGRQAMPIVGSGSARVEFDGQIHEFSARTGKWKHIDIHSLLETAAREGPEGDPVARCRPRGT